MLYKSPPAEVADVRPLSRVNPLVLGQVALLEERLGAVWALVALGGYGPVQPAVSGQPRPLGKDVPTMLAHKLRVLVVAVEMPRKPLL